jgi:glycosyltransferase involved in cell wall biosynthesis
LDYRVVHVGTSLETHGGISAVLKVVVDDAEEKVSHIVTHCDGSVLKRVRVFTSGWLSLVRDLTFRPDHAIYHIHSSARGSWVRKTICVLTIKLFKRPVILHMHGSEFVKFYEREIGPIGRLCVRSVLGAVDIIVALSPEWAVFLQKLAPQTHAAVIPNAVTIPPALGEAHWSPGQPWRIVCLGRLGARKGTFDLLRAFARLREPAELSLAGDGEIELARSLAQELGVVPRVKLLGWIDAEDRAKVLSGAHIFALPSYAEGLPMALLEAMSYGLPIISSPVGGIPTLISNGTNGLLVTPGDTAALTQAIERLMSDPKEAARIGAAGRQTVKEHYAVAAFRAALHELHAELAAKYWGPRHGLAQPKLS